MPAIPTFIDQSDVRVIAVGQEGSLAAENLYKDCRDPTHFTAISGLASLLHYSGFDDKLLLDEDCLLKPNSGLQGSEIQEALQARLDALAMRIPPAGMCLVLSRLGSAQSTALTIQIVLALKRAGKPVIAITALPCEFEGQNSLIVAKMALADIKNAADCVIAMPVKTNSRQKTSLAQMLANTRNTMGAVALILSSLASLDMEFFDTDADIADIKELFQNARHGVAASACLPELTSLRQASDMGAQCLNECLVELPKTKWAIINAIASKDILDWPRFYRLFAKLRNETPFNHKRLKIIYGLNDCRLPDCALTLACIALA